MKMLHVDTFTLNLSRHFFAGFCTLHTSRHAVFSTVFPETFLSRQRSTHIQMSCNLEPRRIEPNRNLGTDPYQVHERFMRNNNQNIIAEDMEGFGKVGAEMSYIQSQVRSDYDSAKSIADSDLVDGELRKMLASPQFMQGRGSCKSSRFPTAQGKPAALLQERGASAEAYSS